MCPNVSFFRARGEGKPFIWWCQNCYERHEHVDGPHDIDTPSCATNAMTFPQHAGSKVSSTQTGSTGSFQLLDVDTIYLELPNGGASIINAKKIGPDAKKKMVDGKEVIKLCDDGLHRVVWEVPMAGVDCEWQCL